MPPKATLHRPAFHEWIFAFPFLLLATRSAFALSPFHPATLFPLAALILLATTIRFNHTHPSSHSHWARLLILPILTLTTYFRLGIDVPALTSFRADAALLALDRLLLGETPAVTLARWHHPILSEVFSTCYLLFYLALLAYHIVWVRSGLRAATPFFAGIYSLYGIGFLGYILFPSVGPWLLPQLHLPTHPPGGPVTTLNHWIVRSGSNGVDVFPSLHCAVTLFMVGYDALQQRRSRFFLALPPAIGLVISTLYLGYHYAVDVLAGFALAALTLVSIARSTARQTTPSNPTQPRS
jgi:membrane-associated phospholipid phosphatase